MEMIQNAIILTECLVWSQENVSRKLIMENFLYANKFRIIIYLQGIIINW